MKPTTTMKRMSTVAKTGRRTQTLASHCMARLLLSPRAVARVDLRAVAHVGGQLGDHLLARLEAAHDRRLLADRLARLDQPILEPPAHVDEDVAQVPVGAHGRRGDRRQLFLTD